MFEHQRSKFRWLPIGLVCPVTDADLPVHADVVRWKMPGLAFVQAV